MATTPLPAWMSLEGRVALITGAGSSSGIGFAIARALGDCGAALEITATGEHAHERSEELNRLGYQARGHVIDLTDEDAVGALVSGIEMRMGSVDILVNNAGMTSAGALAESGSIIGMTLETWHSALGRNLDTAFLVSRAVLPRMHRVGWGRIVNIASVTGPVMAMHDEPAYAAAKAGMVGLTRALALDFAASGITVNAIAPGWIATGAQTAHEADQGMHTPVGWSGAPDHVASLVAYVCSPSAGYLTGQCLVVDGGNAIAEER